MNIIFLSIYYFFTLPFATVTAVIDVYTIKRSRDYSYNVAYHTFIARGENKEIPVIR